MALYDLLIKGGTLLDPAQGLHATRDVALAQGVVAAVAEEIPSWQAAQVLDATGRLVAPGMIDLHVHIKGDLIMEKIIMNAQLKEVARDGNRLVYART